MKGERGKRKIRRGAGLDGAAPLAFYWLGGKGIVGVIRVIGGLGGFRLPFFIVPSGSA